MNSINSTDKAQQKTDDGTDTNNESTTTATEHIWQRRDPVSRSSRVTHEKEEETSAIDQSRKRSMTSEDKDESSAQNKRRIRRVGKAFQPLEQQTESSSSSKASSGGFQSKHDQRWDLMLEQLVEYKRKYKNTMVPQCYEDQPRLGRWVHYQRVEYWLYRENGKAKITKDRIERLEQLGFDWDPQKAQWELMFGTLQAFHKKMGHCRVPKGYSEDPNLANWVRNQRLEFVNLQKGKKTRMTEERKLRLDSIGFVWSKTKMEKQSGNEKERGFDMQDD